LNEEKESAGGQEEKLQRCSSKKENIFLHYLH